MLRRQFVAGLAAAPISLALPRLARAASPDVFAEGGLALRGTDPVSYFTHGAPVAGTSDFALMWHGATWLFESAASRTAFEMNPGAHAPRYGGYCAYAMSLGHIAPTDPQAWTITEGRLYLNYSIEVRQLWRTDIPSNIRKADGHWPGVLG